MKNLILSLLASTMLLMASCSKDSKINRHLDGKWKVTKEDGQALQADETQTLTFEKTKGTEGTGTYEVSSSGFTLSAPFSYSIDDENITINLLGSSTMKVSEHSKTKMVFTDGSGDSLEMEKI